MNTTVKRSCMIVLVFFFALVPWAPVAAQSNKAPTAPPAAQMMKLQPAPESGELELTQSEIAPLIERYVADRISLQRLFSESGGFGRPGLGGGGFGGARGEGGGARASPAVSH